MSGAENRLAGAEDRLVAGAEDRLAGAEDSSLVWAQTVASGGHAESIRLAAQGGAGIQARAGRPLVSLDRIGWSIGGYISGGL